MTIHRNSDKSKSLPYSLSNLTKYKIPGKLKPPKESTPIDVAIFANDVFTKYTPKNSTENQKLEPVKSQEKLFINSRKI